MIIGSCILDINKFKAVNDTYGHDFGDDLLIQLLNFMENVVLLSVSALVLQIKFIVTRQLMVCNKSMHFPGWTSVHWDFRGMLHFSKYTSFSSGILW